MADLDMLRDKLYSESDGRLMRRVSERVDAIAKELDRLRIEEIGIPRADGSVLQHSVQQVMLSIHGAMFTAQRDAERSRYVTQFLERVDKMKLDVDERDDDRGRG